MEIAIKIIMIKMTTMGSSFQLFSGTMGIWSVGFVGGVKPEDLEKNLEKPSKEGRTINKINPHVTPGSGALSAMPSPLPS